MFVLADNSEMRNYLWFLGAAVCEIAGCYGVWLCLRGGRSRLWLIVAVASLVLFAVLLTRVDITYAGRAYAAYGGIYIVASLIWLAVIEGQRPSLTDVAGSALCIAGAAVTLLGARSS
jgi:small multidrug resistance family-3 protein